MPVGELLPLRTRRLVPAEAALEGFRDAPPGDLTSLRQLQGELVQAFPALYQQDAMFRSRADALGIALQEGTAAGAECAALAEQLKNIESACDDCHRDYR